MVTIFHLSDLHIHDSAFWHNLESCVLDEAKSTSCEKILIITGDFHDYAEGDYNKAAEHINKLIKALEIKPDRDVFIIPGNHDVGSPAAMKQFFQNDDDWLIRQEAEVAWLKSHNSAESTYLRHVEARLVSYKPYCKFVRSLGLYTDEEDEYLPARVHVRCWDNRLNILHLNTTLVASGCAERAELLDDYTATNNEIWQKYNKSLPALALGHNSFYDLDNRQQLVLMKPMIDYGICAYLCGDVHTEEKNSNKKVIRLGAGYIEVEEIPNVVGIKSASDENDRHSDFGLYIHRWDENSKKVEVQLLRWQPTFDQTKFQLKIEGTYNIPRISKSDMQVRSENYSRINKENKAYQKINKKNNPTIIVRFRKTFSNK